MKQFALLFTWLITSWAAYAQTEGTNTYTYTTDSKLTITDENGRTQVSTDRGQNIVFVYEFKKKDDPAIADDEYTLRVMFELPVNGKKFRIEAKDGKVVMMKGCFCTDRGYHRITTGYISGRKTCKGWKITWKLEAKTIEDSPTNNFKSEVNAVFMKLVPDTK